MKYRTATQWGVYDVTVDGEQIVAVEGIAEDPHPSPLGDALVDGVVSKERIRKPAVRKGWLAHRDRGKRGADEFVEVPWDEALDLAAVRSTVYVKTLAIPPFLPVHTDGPPQGGLITLSRNCTASSTW